MKKYAAILAIFLATTGEKCPDRAIREACSADPTLPVCKPSPSPSPSPVPTPAPEPSPSPTQTPAPSPSPVATPVPVPSTPVPVPSTTPKPCVSAPAGDPSCWKCSELLEYQTRLVGDDPIPDLVVIDREFVASPYCRGAVVPKKGGGTVKVEREQKNCEWYSRVPKDGHPACSFWGKGVDPAPKPLAGPERLGNVCPETKPCAPPSPVPSSTPPPVTGESDVASCVVLHYDAADGAAGCKIAGSPFVIPAGCKGRAIHVTATPKNAQGKDARIHGRDLTWYVGGVLSPDNVDTEVDGCLVVRSDGEERTFNREIEQIGKCSRPVPIYAVLNAPDGKRHECIFQGRVPEIRTQ